MICQINYDGTIMLQKCKKHPDLIGKYQTSVKDMAADSFPDQFNAVVQLVLSLSLFFKFYY